MTPLKMLLLALTLTPLAACATSGKTPPVVVGFQFPPMPGDAKTCFKSVVPVPEKNLTVADVESLWKQDRVRVRVNQACGERFIRWYDDLAKSGGVHDRDG